MVTSASKATSPNNNEVAQDPTHSSTTEKVVGTSILPVEMRRKTSKKLQRHSDNVRKAASELTQLHQGNATRGNKQSLRS